MLHDHEYHPLTVVDVVDETADTRSFVLEIPAALADDLRLRRRAVLHLPGDDRRRAGRALLLDVELARRRRPVHHDGEARARRAHVELDERHARARRHDRRDAPGRALRAPRPTDAPIVAFAGGSGITPVISIIKTRARHHRSPDHARVREPRRRRGHLRRRARPPATRHPAAGSRSTITSTPSAASSTPRGCAAFAGDRDRRRLLRLRSRAVHGHGRGRARRRSASPPDQRVHRAVRACPSEAPAEPTAIAAPSRS